MTLCDSDRPAEGVILTTDAARIFRRVFKPEQWEMGAALSARGHCLGQAGRFTEGEGDLLAALETVGASLGPDHQRYEAVRKRLVQLYEAWGRPEEAEKSRGGVGEPQG